MNDAPRPEPPPPDPQARRSFLDARRGSSQQRFDERYAATYDEDWGEISPGHKAAVLRLLDLTRAHGTVLDAACGTGKFWPFILDSGRTVVGVDHSSGMLLRAAAKHPEVATGKIALQDLAFDAIFDAVICVDAMEYIGPEDWPVVLGGLRNAARPGAILYLTVELPEDEEEVRRNTEAARARGEPVVPGEAFGFDGGGYHYYPQSEAIHRWLEEAGLERVGEYEEDVYQHLLLQRPA